MKKQSSKRSKSKKTWPQPRLTWLEAKFPSIYRIITEFGGFRLVWPTYRFLVFFFTVLFLLGIVVSGYSLYRTIQAKQATDAERARVLQEIRYWEKIVAKYTGYRDAYLQLAVLEYRLGELDKARYFANKGFAIDPNSKEVGEMLRLLR